MLYGENGSEFINIWLTFLLTSKTFNSCYLLGTFYTVGEEITDDAAIKDLAYREADTPIFTRLGLTYGKAMKFRKEFGEHVQSLQSRPSSPPVKPTMAAIASFSPEMRRLYLSK